MARFSDYVVTSEIRDMMEKILTAFPSEYPGFDVEGIHTVMTKGKKSKSHVYRLKSCKYPEDTLHDKVYTLEVFEENWKLLSQKQKDHIINKVMMSIPEGGFDLNSDEYAKIKKPDYQTFAKEHRFTDGAVNWLEDDSKLPDLFSKSSAPNV